jgi:uncharacterized phage-like protein YoqJ
LIVAGTGHRPNKIVVGKLNGYDKAVQALLEQVAARCLRKLKPDLVVSGMALGWDMALAAAALANGIEFDAYVPFGGQESKWPKQSQMRYRTYLTYARQIVVCSEGGYSAKAMQVRNERMVDVCDVLVALWDGSSGGTANCLYYALRQVDAGCAIKVHNVWGAWTRHSSP